MALRKINPKYSLNQLIIVAVVMSVVIVTLVAFLLNQSYHMMTAADQLKNKDLLFNKTVQNANEGFLAIDDQTNMWVGLGVGNERFGDEKLAGDTLEQAKSGEREILDSLNSLKDLVANSDEQSHLQQAVQYTNQYLDFFHQVEQLNETDHKKAEQTAFIDNVDVSNSLTSDLQALQSDADKRVIDQSQQTLANAQVVNHIAFFTGILLTILAFCLLYIWRKLRPLKAVVNELKEVSNGNLAVNTVTINSYDEIGELSHAVTVMTKKLRVLIKQVLQGSEQVASSSEELTACAGQSAQAATQVAVSITDLANGTEKQRQSIYDTSAALEQMSTSIQQIATNTNTVAEASEKTAVVANEGGSAVKSAVNQMNIIEKTVMDSAEIVAKLGERSKEIGQIVDTISGIAGQTNLLALNAAIEAARAGEQGRGFAVVAEEVRKLAEQSQDAAKQIATLISEIQGETTVAVAAMNNGTREVKTGGEVVQKAGQSFEKIVSLVNDVSGQIREVSVAIQQMSSGSQQIVAAVRDIDMISKNIAGQTQSVSATSEEQTASMEEIASSSQALATIAQDLHSAVTKFQV